MQLQLLNHHTLNCKPHHPYRLPPIAELANLFE
ncbi:unnamed protein product, partial [Allacma fusca]